MNLNNLPKSLLITIKATHFNFVNKNNVLYTENAVSRGVKSWTSPFNKPQLVGHDTKKDPIGRIVNAKLIKGETIDKTPPNYVELTAKITDPDAIAKILDGRYYTVSVGSTSCRVICSECDQVITEDGLCEHKKGSYNEKGEPIYWVIDQIGYTEDSFVNEPADEYAAIDKVYIGGEWVNFTKLLDSTESSDFYFKMEDNYMADGDRSSTKKLDNLPESTFCGPNRTFPGHDKAHVLAGINLLDKVTFADDTKAKILANLYRKGERYGIVPQGDDADKIDLLFRMEDDFKEGEIEEIDNWFKENPDSDLPQAENADTKNNEETSNEDSASKDASKMKKDELVEEVTKLRKEIEDSKDESKKAIDLRDSKIQELEDKVKATETIAYEKEDDLNKYIDKVYAIEKKYKDAIISNIIDIKLTDNTCEERDTLVGAFAKRTLDSLEDSLNDLRIEHYEKPLNSDHGVDDPTRHVNNTDTKLSDSNGSESDSEETGDPRFRIFSVDKRKITEAE